MSQYLIMLILLPLMCFQLTKMWDSDDKWLLRGMSVGMVIAPLSYGFLQFTYIPIIGKLLGMIGLVFHLTHGPLGYFCLAGSGFLEPGSVLTVPQLTMINLVNGFIFAYTYGMIGYAIDRKLETVTTEVLFEETASF